MRSARRLALLDIFTRLLDCYGPRHWWPGDTPFEVMVGAIMTQSTAWTNVEKAVSNLKTARALSPKALRKMSLAEIARLVRPCGYYNTKARKLKALVAWLEESCGDDIRKLSTMDTANLRAELLEVYGIGPETADSILLYALGRPVFVIDAYTRRILGRVGLTPERDSYDEYQHLFTDALPSDIRLFNEYHALLVQHGKTTCRKRPLCPQCCLFDICQENKAR